MNPTPWPRAALQHEMRSMRKWLRDIVQLPKEIQIKGEEGTFGRPMILITPIGTRTEQMGKEMFYVHRSMVFTWFGSELDEVDDPHEEAWEVCDVMNEVLSRGLGFGGPIIPIFDFSTDNPIQTEDWIEVAPTSTFDVRRDEYNLYTVPMDIRYVVPRSGLDVVTAPIPTTGSPQDQGTEETPPGQIDWPVTVKPIITTVNRVRI